MEWEILEDGKDGLISSIDDHFTLGEDIYKVMSNSEIWQKYSTLSLERAKDFSPNVVKQQFNDFIETLW